MTKEQALDIIKLLSALESWAFASKIAIPDYMHGRLAESMDVLTNEVLK